MKERKLPKTPEDVRVSRAARKLLGEPELSDTADFLAIEAEQRALRNSTPKTIDREK